MSKNMPLFFMRNNGSLVPLPEKYDEAVSTVTKEVLDGHVHGSLCTLRSPVRPHLEVGGLKNVPSFKSKALDWLGHFLPNAPRASFD